MRPLVYYISGHGFGHAVRSAEIIRAIQLRQPDLPIQVCTTAPAWLFPASTIHRPVELDVGVVQFDALQADYATTLARLRELVEEASRLIEQESSFLRAARAGLVAADIPPIAFRAARAAGIPSVGVANFSWDWIYEPYLDLGAQPADRRLYDWLRDSYAQADLLLRLPFHGDLSAFKRLQDVPLVSRPASQPRPALRARLGLRPDERAVLLGFGGLGLHGLSSQRLGELADYRFVTTEKELQTGQPRPPNVILAPAQQSNYSDLLAACDAVVTKPGFGMVASCLAERIPLVYVDRHDFREYDVLVDAIQRYGRGVHIPRTELLAGNLDPYLRRLENIPQPDEPLRTDGAEVAAERMLELLAS